MMCQFLEKIEDIKKNLEIASFLVNMEGSERELHGKIIESLVIVSQLEQDIKFSNNSLDRNLKPMLPIPSVDGHIYSDGNNRDQQEVKKVLGRLQKWFRNPRQYNSTILFSYLRLAEVSQKVSVEDLKNECGAINDFYGNYNQMKNFGEKNHGKVFEERDGYVTLWEPVKETILKMYKEKIT